MAKSKTIHPKKSFTLKRSHTILIASIFITTTLYWIPNGQYFAYPLLLISTLVHEMGHGLAAILVGANFETFSMWYDGSGHALITGNPSRIGTAIIAAGGLIGPSIGAAICFVLGKTRASSRLALSVFGVLLIVSEFFYVRGLFGMVFVALLAAMLLYLAQQPTDWVASFGLVFLAVQLALSVFSRSDYLFTKTALTDTGPMPSDVENMAQALLLPYWFWGSFCGIFSVFVLYCGLKYYIKNS